MVKLKLSFFLEILFVIFVFFVAFLLDITKIETGKIVIVIVFLSNIQQLIKFRFSDIIFIFLFFSILYWVYLIPYYFFDIPYHIYLEYQTPYLTNMVVLMQFLFQRLSLIGICKNNFKRPVEFMNVKKNDILFYIFILILTFFSILGVYGQETILNQAYSIDTHSSKFFEYCIPLFIVAFMYADTKRKKYLLLFFGFIFMIEPLLFGRRLPFLMVAFTIFNLYYSGKFKMRYIFIGGIICFVLLRYLGDLRNPIDGEVGLFVSLFSLSSKGIIQNNQGGVVLCAVTYLGLVKEGLFDVLFRIKSFVGLFTGILMPSSFNIQEAYVNFEAAKYANIPGNGGFPSVYLYLWGGYLGIILGALGFNKLLKNKTKSRVIAIYVLFLLSVFPRWYAYNLMILFKMGFLLILLIGVSDTFHKYVYPKKNKSL